MSFSCSFDFSQDKISSILPSTKTARRRLISGVTIATQLIHKLVKPGKLIPSRCANQIRIDQLLIVETEANMRTARAAVLRKPDTTVERELRGLDLADRRCQKATKFQSLFFRDKGFQILDFGLVFSYEHYERYFGDAGDPGIADQLWVERRGRSVPRDNGWTWFSNP